MNFCTKYAATRTPVGQPAGRRAGEAHVLQRKQNGTAAPEKPRCRQAPGYSVSLIGAGLTITGNVIAAGDVQVDGRVEGDVHSARLVIGEAGEVAATSMPRSVIVRGRVMGRHPGPHASPGRHRHVEGDVAYESLVVESAPISTAIAVPAPCRTIPARNASPPSMDGTITIACRAGRAADARPRRSLGAP